MATNIYGEPIVSIDYLTRECISILSTIASNGRPQSEILKTEKGATVRGESGIQKPGDYGLKNVTPLPKATIFIVTEAILTADAA